MNRLGRTAGGGRNGGAMDGSGGGHPDPPARFPGGAASPHPAGAASLHPAGAASPQPAGAASIQAASLRAAGAASPECFILSTTLCNHHLIISLPIFYIFFISRKSHY